LTRAKIFIWIDQGKDFYAAQAWNDAPGGRPIWIAWMNNWQYANEIPTSPWRGAMTVPRSVSLKRTKTGLRMVQTPIAALSGIRGQHRAVAARPIRPGETPLGSAGVEGVALEIDAEFEPGSAEEFGMKVRKGEGEETVIGVPLRGGMVYVDRSRSGTVGFSRHFPGRHAAPLASDDRRRVRLHLLVDLTSVEVFADGGRVVLTEQLFPNPTSRGVSLFATGGEAQLCSLDAWELRP
jgi:sucrose-6-phosphate hydrolase SacC (GH32 family)